MDVITPSSLSADQSPRWIELTDQKTIDNGSAGNYDAGYASVLGWQWEYYVNLAYPLTEGQLCLLYAPSFKSYCGCRPDAASGSITSAVQFHAVASAVDMAGLTWANRPGGTSIMTWSATGQFTCDYQSGDAVVFSGWLNANVLPIIVPACGMAALRIATPIAWRDEYVIVRPVYQLNVPARMY